MVCFSPRTKRKKIVNKGWQRSVIYSWALLTVRHHLGAGRCGTRTVGADTRSVTKAQPQCEGEGDASHQGGVLPACGGKMPVRVFWRIASPLSPNGDVCACSLPSVDGGCSCSFEVIRAPCLEAGDRRQKASLAGVSHNQRSGNGGKDKGSPGGRHTRQGLSPPGLLVCDKGHRPLGRVLPTWESLWCAEMFEDFTSDFAGSPAHSRIVPSKVL